MKFEPPDLFGIPGAGEDLLSGQYKCLHIVQVVLLFLKCVHDTY